MPPPSDIPVPCPLCARYDAGDQAYCGRCGRGVSLIAPNPLPQPTPPPAEPQPEPEPEPEPGTETELQLELKLLQVAMVAVAENPDKLDLSRFYGQPLVAFQCYRTIHMIRLTSCMFCLLPLPGAGVVLTVISGPSYEEMLNQSGRYEGMAVPPIKSWENIADTKPQVNQLVGQTFSGFRLQPRQCVFEFGSSYALLFNDTQYMVLRNDEPTQ